MGITITEIKFNYDNGYENEFTDVRLNFAAGSAYALKGPVKASKDEYQQSSSDLDELKTLIKEKVIEGMQNAKITVTGINFEYGDGFDNPYTSVNLSFITSNTEFDLSGPITVTKNEYKEAADDLKGLIKAKVIADLQA